MMQNLTQDPMFFYAVAFVIFVGLVGVYGRKPALGWIDGEIAKIRAELDQATQLRAEAEAALADCKARQAAAETEAKEILTNARRQVEAQRAQAALDLAAATERHKHIAAERIRLAEAEAVAEVRAAAIDLAMAMARKSLSENLSPTDTARLIDTAIADLPALKAVKAKAA